MLEQFVSYLQSLSPEVLALLAGAVGMGFLQLKKHVGWTGNGLFPCTKYIGRNAGLSGLFLTLFVPTILDMIISPLSTLLGFRVKKQTDLNAVLRQINFELTRRIRRLEDNDITIEDLSSEQAAIDETQSEMQDLLESLGKRLNNLFLEIGAVKADMQVLDTVNGKTVIHSSRLGTVEAHLAALKAKVKMLGSDADSTARKVLVEAKRQCAEVKPMVRALDQQVTRLHEAVTAKRTEKINYPAGNLPTWVK